MPFPTTSVLTAFPGANEEPLSEGSTWLDTIRINTAAVKPCRVLSNTAAPSTTASTASESAYGTTYGADQESFATISALPASGKVAEVYCRIQNRGLSNVNYYAFAYLPGTGLLFVKQTLASGQVQVGSTIVQTLSAGNKIGLEVIGTTLSGYIDTGSGWTLAGSTTDSEISGGGLIGISMSNAGDTARLDDFGGGTVILTVSPLGILPEFPTERFGPF